MPDQAERLRQLSRFQNKNNTRSKRKVARFIAVASGKGGVGKTNFVVNAALVLSQWGVNVVIIDADLGMANVDVLLDLRPRATLWHVVRGEKEIADVILKGPANLKIIPGGSGFFDLANLDTSRRDLLIEGISSLDSDLIFVDCAAGISRNVLGFIGAADELLTVITPEPASITDAYGMLKVIDEHDMRPRIYVVVNCAQDSREGKEVFERLQLTCSRFLGVDLIYLGAIYDDLLVKSAVQKCSPFVLSYPRSRASADIKQAAQRLLHNGQLSKGRKGRSVGDFISRLFSIRR